MKYPMRNHYLVFKRVDKNKYSVRNVLTEEEWIMNHTVAKFIYRLDGKTDPCKIVPYISKREVIETLDFLEREGLLLDEHRNRICTAGFGTVMFTLFQTKFRKKSKYIARILNLCLISFWLPALILGSYIFQFHLHQNITGIFENPWGCIPGYFIGIISGLLFHEIAHAFSCLAYGGHVFEFGVMLRTFLPAAYVLIDYKDLRNCLKKTQISAAGIEMNLLLAGFYFLLSSEIQQYKSAFFVAAIVNVILASINLSLIEGFDGMAILSDLIGDSELLDKARAIIHDRKKKEILKRRGVNGRATIAVSYMLVGTQIMLPVLIGVNVLNLLGGWI
jgi:hypothetical protein